MSGARGTGHMEVTDQTRAKGKEGSLGHSKDDQHCRGTVEQSDVICRKGSACFGRVKCLD